MATGGGALWTGPMSAGGLSQVYRCTGVQVYTVVYCSRAASGVKCVQATVVYGSVQYCTEVYSSVQ